MNEKPRILLTRSREQIESLSEKVEALGYTAVPFPVITFERLHTPQLDDALAQLDQFDWLLFTSGNAVRFFQEAAAEGWQARYNGRVGAVGSATVKALEKYCVRVDFVPDEFTGEELATGLGDIAKKRILLPRAKLGRPDITKRLEEQDAFVDDVPLYDTVTAVPNEDEWQQLCMPLHVIIFTSPSSVRNLHKIMESRPEHVPNPLEQQPSPLIACIGPSTQEEAEAFGLTVQVVPDSYTIDDLVTAVDQALKVKP